MVDELSDLVARFQKRRRHRGSVLPISCFLFVDGDVRSVLVPQSRPFLVSVPRATMDILHLDIEVVMNLLLEDAEVAR